MTTRTWSINIQDLFLKEFLAVYLLNQEFVFAVFVAAYSRMNFHYKPLSLVDKKNNNSPGYMNDEWDNLKIFEHQEQLQNYSNPLIIKKKRKEKWAGSNLLCSQFLDIATQINNRKCIKYTQYSLKNTHTLLNSSAKICRKKLKRNFQPVVYKILTYFLQNSRRREIKIAKLPSWFCRKILFQRTSALKL